MLDQAPRPPAQPKVGSSLRLLWRTESDCQACAEALARLIEPPLRSGASVLIELHGTLGAGKTTFTRHLLRALGVQGRIKSPSYAVVEPHDLPGLPIWHFDFYRFADPREWEDAGFRDVFGSPGLKLVEWPDKAAGLLPPADLCLNLQSRADDARQAHWQADTAQGQALMAALSTAPSWALMMHHASEAS